MVEASEPAVAHGHKGGRAREGGLGKDQETKRRGERDEERREPTGGAHGPTYQRKKRGEKRETTLGTHMSAYQTDRSMLGAP